jgi:hypothetical protein
MARVRPNKFDIFARGKRPHPRSIVFRKQTIQSPMFTYRSTGVFVDIHELGALVRHISDNVTRQLSLAMLDGTDAGTGIPKKKLKGKRQLSDIDDNRRGSIRGVKSGTFANMIARAKVRQNPRSGWARTTIQVPRKGPMVGDDVGNYRLFYRKERKQGIDHLNFKGPLIRSIIDAATAQWEEAAAEGKVKVGGLERKLAHELTGKTFTRIRSRRGTKIDKIKSFRRKARRLERKLNKERAARR